MSITYGVSARYGGSTYSVSGYDTREAAAEDLAGILIGAGYTFPKPWEFWRWGEHEPSKILREALERKGLK